LLVSFDSEVR